MRMGVIKFHFNSGDVCFLPELGINREAAKINKSRSLSLGSVWKVDE